MALADIQKLCDTGDPVLKILFTHHRARLLSLLDDHKVALHELQDALPEWTELAGKGAKLENIVAKSRMLNLNFSEEAKKQNLGPPGGVLRKTDLVQLYLHIAEMQKKT